MSDDGTPSTTATTTDGTAHSTRMLHSDAFAWYMEKDPVLRSTIVAVSRLASEPDWHRLHDRIDRLTRLVPTLRMTVQSPPARIGPPRWAIDDNFDLDFHLRRVRLPDPAGWAEVLDFARIAAMDGFDRSRPLWEFTLIEGMADGGAAFVTKLHHSLTDGIGGIQLAALVLDPGPDEADQGEMPEAPSGHPPSPLELATRSVVDDVAEAVGAANRVVRALPTGTLHALRHPWSSAQGAAATAVSVGRFVAPVNRQFSALLGRRRTSRVLATIDVSTAELHDAAAAAGGHLNDAFLAALTDGLHRYHVARDSPLDEVRVTVPVSLRGAHDPVGGNRITLTRIVIPAAIGEPAERIEHIAATVRRWRAEPALGHAQEIAFGLNLLPRPYLGGIFKRVELLASDVPGLRQPMWLAGARITGYYAFGPTIGSALNATLMSYAGTCNIGLNIDTGAVDDPNALIDCLYESFAEVLALSHHRSAGGRSAPADEPSTEPAPG